MQFEDNQANTVKQRNDDINEHHETNDTKIGGWSASFRVHGAVNCGRIYLCIIESFNDFERTAKPINDGNRK